MHVKNMPLMLKLLA